MPTVGVPRDPAPWIALGLAIVLLAIGPRLLRTARSRLLLILASITAALLSAAYVSVYLRGGPRIIDASAYWLEARALSRGLFSFPLGEPEQSVLGRFLVRSEHDDGAHAAVIFPPGWPAILALGFLARAPMAVGPLLAAAIAVATYDLAGSLAKSLKSGPLLGVAPPDEPHPALLPRLALLFSVTSAALRYHTADTMSHGLAALSVAASLALALRALDAIGEGRSPRAWVLGSGLALGWLFATRPVSALAPAIAIAYLALRDPSLERDRARRALRLALPLALGALPGVCLFFAHQHAATGAWGASSQRLYYELSDGPPGCFRYGFGAGIGCVGEHGDFVRAHLAEGFGFVAAAGTTLRRIRMHLIDPLNAEPLALLVLAGALLVRGSPRGRALGLAVLAQILAYAPFYFDGNYPAGGGRFYCDVLPVEHALAAAAVVTIGNERRAPERFAAAALALSLLGFALRAGFHHAALRDRDGGRPLFEPAALAHAGVTRGLVFIDTDHGFDLAFDPRPAGDLAFARGHGDDLDRITWEARGRPPAHRYAIVPSASGSATVVIEPVHFAPVEARVIEAESLWPPVAQDRGFALITWASGSCASAARLLTVHGDGRGERASITLSLPARALAGHAMTARIALGEGARGELILRADGVEIARRPFTAPAGAALSCVDLPSFRAPRAASRLTLELAREGESAPTRVALDALSWREND